MYFQSGDEVLAPWLDDGFLYPAVLVALEGDQAHVAYLDGDEADIAASSLSQSMFGPGLVVHVNWKGRRAYYPGVIQRRLGMAVFMHYDDGTKGWATIAQCRVAVAVAESQKAQVPDTLACSFCGGSVPGSVSRCSNCGAMRPGRA
jgi:hypothetical protein